MIVGNVILAFENKNKGQVIYIPTYSSYYKEYYINIYSKYIEYDDDVETKDLSLFLNRASSQEELDFAIKIILEDYEKYDLIKICKKIL